MIKKSIAKSKPNSRHVRLPDRIQIDDEWLFVFGWYAAEGFSSISPSKGRFVSFSGHQKERHILERIAKVFDRLGAKSTIYASKTTKGIELRVYSIELAIWFMAWFGHTAKHKKLPEELMNLSARQSAILLRAYIEGDGHTRNGGHEWVSANKELAVQFCLLSAKCGYAPCMHRSSPASSRHSRNKGRDNLPDDKEKRNWVGSVRQATATSKPYILRKVRSVTLDYQRRPKVYDLTVEDDHSFMVGFASVHNCHRIGQKDSVTCSYLVIEDSLDDVMLSSINKKRDTLHETLDIQIS
jgi:hypothetical protein